MVKFSGKQSILNSAKFYTATGKAFVSNIGYEKLALPLKDNTFLVSTTYVDLLHWEDNSQTYNIF